MTLYNDWYKNKTKCITTCFRKITYIYLLFLKFLNWATIILIFLKIYATMMRKLENLPWLYQMLMFVRSYYTDTICILSGANT